MATPIGELVRVGFEAEYNYAEFRETAGADSRATAELESMIETAQVLYWCATSESQEQARNADDISKDVIMSSIMAGPVMRAIFREAHTHDELAQERIKGRHHFYENYAAYWDMALAEDGVHTARKLLGQAE